MYKIKVVQIDYTGKQPNKVLLETGINKALEEVEGEVIRIENWSQTNLNGALIIIVYKVKDFKANKIEN